MNLNVDDAVQITCQKIDYNIRGVSLIKISLNDQGNITDHYSMTPSNRSYMNDAKFFHKVLSPILQNLNNQGKPGVLNFSQGFPALEMLSYRPDQKESIQDEKTLNEINGIVDTLMLEKITLGKQIPIKDQRKYTEGNQIFEDFKKANINPREFNNIIYTKEYQVKYPKSHHSNSLNIIKNTDSEGVKSYIITYQDKDKKIKNEKIYQFDNLEDEKVFFTELLKELENKNSKTIVYNNDYNLFKYKPENSTNIKMKKVEPLPYFLDILNDKDIVNHYKDKKENLPSLNHFILKGHMDNELKALRDKHVFNLMSVRGVNVYRGFKENLSDKGISNIIMKRETDENSENIFVSVVQTSKEENGTFTTDICNFSVDMQKDNEDEVVFSKFAQIFENKLGYPISSSNSSKCQISLENFEDRGVFAWKLRNEFKTNIVNFGWESNTPYTNMLNDYIKNNFENTNQKNRLMASDGPTDENTICVYSDASLYQKNKNSIAYGAVVRAPNSDKIIHEISGVKRVNHQEETCIAEEIGIIESLKSIKMLMDQGILSKEKNVEIRCDNIHVIEGLSDKDGKDNKIEEMYSSEVYSKKEINELLSYFNNVNFKWIKGHCNDVYNEKADLIAKKSWALMSSKGYQNYGHKKICDEKIKDSHYEVIASVSDNDKKNRYNKHKRRRKA